MSKLIYFLIPLGIIITGITLLNYQKSTWANDMKFISGHLQVISAEPPADLTFCDSPVPLDNFDVRERLDRELQRYVYFHSSTILQIKRAHRYNAIFKRILRENDIPEDFFYMAMAESALSNVTSPKGARGFWQFMKGTALQYGLEISETVDERYFPEKSTRAACRYLNDSYKQFGDWSLVAASYNMGAGGVAKAVRRQKKNNYYDLHLNSETSRYLFRILAYKIIMERPANYGFNLSKRQKYKPVPYRTVSVNENIEDLVQFALDNGSSYRMLKIMNPWLISDRLEVAPDKSYTLRFPKSTNIYPDELLADKKAFADDTTSVDSMSSLLFLSDSLRADSSATEPGISTDSLNAMGADNIVLDSLSLPKPGKVQADLDSIKTPDKSEEQ